MRRPTRARRSPGHGAASWAALLWAFVAAGCGGGGGAGAPPVPAASGPAPEVSVLEERGGTAGALALVVPGSAWEDDGTSGLTLLAARSVLEDAAPALEGLGARAEVACRRWAFVVTMVAPRETWREAAGVLVSALEAASPSYEAVGRARAELSASLALDRANPAWQARLASTRALYAGGAGSAWARPACGVPETLGLFDTERVREAASRLGTFRSVAVVTPPDSVEVEAVAALFRGAVSRGEGLFPSPGPQRAEGVYVERNTVTAWVSVAWPFGPGADPEAVRLVGAILEDAVGPAVSRPEVLHVSAEVELHGHGGALIVTAVVAPERAAAVASALEAGAMRLAAGEEHASVVERVARWWRGVRLGELESPEARAARAALDVARGVLATAWPAAESFTPEAVRAAAAELGAPARAVVGPRPARGAAVP